MLIALCPEVEQVLPLQPDIDALNLGVPKTGWHAVKKWCEDYGPWLKTYLSASYGSPVDILVIHVDADIASQLGVDLPCPPAEKICETVAHTVKRWLRKRPPAQIVIAVPAMKIETWLCVALLRSTNPNIECEPRPELYLVKRKLLPKDEHGQPVKDLSVYRELAPTVAKKLQTIRQVCGEADRFATRVEKICQRK
jgi:hypothetical protein